MKLYTEEQVKMMLVRAKIFDGNVLDNFVFIMSEDEILHSETPIELPSDEEISTIAMALYGFKATSIKDVLEYKAFKRGAKLVINKIQGGNK